VIGLLSTRYSTVSRRSPGGADCPGHAALWAPGDVNSLARVHLCTLETCRRRCAVRYMAIRPGRAWSRGTDLTAARLSRSLFWRRVEVKTERGIAAAESSRVRGGEHLLRPLGRPVPALTEHREVLGLVGVE